MSGIVYIRGGIHQLVQDCMCSERYTQTAWVLPAMGYSGLAGVPYKYSTLPARVRYAHMKKENQSYQLLTITK